MSLTLVELDVHALSDSELVQRVRQSEGRAFELVMRRHNRLPHRTARAILRDDMEAVLDRLRRPTVPDG